MKVKQAVCPHAYHGATTQTHVNTLDPSLIPKESLLICVRELLRVSRSLMTPIFTTNSLTL